MQYLFAAAIVAVLWLGVATSGWQRSESSGTALVLAHAVLAAPRIRRLTTHQLMEKLGVRSRETLRKLQRKPGFPQPVHDEGSPVKFFFEHEADAYLERLAKARDSAQQPEHQVAA